MHTQIPHHTLRNFFLMVLIMGAAFAILRPAFSQDDSIKNDPNQNVNKISTETSGATLYTIACASCHGADGKGNGPVAASLKNRPTDLTLLSRENGGKFPTDHIQYVLSNEGPDTVHGSKGMPVWGPIFRLTGGRSHGIAFMRCRNVTEYLNSIQVK